MLEKIDSPDRVLALEAVGKLERDGLRVGPASRGSAA